jgi:hypothetical protein
MHLEGPGPHVLLELWSIIFRQKTKNKSCSAPSQIINLVKFQPPRLSLDPNPGGQGGTILGCSVSTASTVSLGKKIIKEKLKGTSILFGVDQIFGFVIWIWKDICSLT